MPITLVLVYGGALAAPTLLFAVLIWSGVERVVEQDRQERRIRARAGLVRDGITPVPARAVLDLLRRRPLSSGHRTAV